jgi:hypothetical protein
MTEQEGTLFLSQISVKPLDEVDKRNERILLSFWAKLGKVLISCLNDALRTPYVN